MKTFVMSEPLVKHCKLNFVKKIIYVSSFKFLYKQVKRYSNKQILQFNPLSELVGGRWMIERWKSVFLSKIT